MGHKSFCECDACKRAKREYIIVPNAPPMPQTEAEARDYLSVGESRDGTGAGDHDQLYVFQRTDLYLSTRDKARALIVRSRLDDAVLDAAVLNDAQLKLVDRHVLANREVYK